MSEPRSITGEPVSKGDGAPAAATNTPAGTLASVVEPRRRSRVKQSGKGDAQCCGVGTAGFVVPVDQIEQELKDPIINHAESQRLREKGWLT